MSHMTPTPTLQKAEPPWWRIPQVVFVPALLLLGVLATSTMVVISSMDQDPVLDKAVYERELKAAQALQGQARIDALMAAQPAQQGRNHAASPKMPSDQ
ncbi:MAG: nitrogen fixation protein FixH [Hydrogenophaga sp.]